MPKLWTDTIDQHRRAVRDAILDAMAELAVTDGVLSVSMSNVADRAGIGRKTLYKYYPDLDSILTAWHERQIAGHLAELRRTSDNITDPGQRLEEILRAHALMAYRHHATDPSPQIMSAPHVTSAQQQLRAFLTTSVEAAVAANGIRRDIKATEIADYLLHALSAAASHSSKAAVDRLVRLTMDALRHPERPCETPDVFRDDRARQQGSDAGSA